MAVRTLTPAADKSAFWYIHADIAERVTELPSLSSVAPVAPKSAFPLYIAERQKRLKAEQELEDGPNPNDEPSESVLLKRIGLYVAWLIAAVVLVSAAVGKHPYSFYTLLRWICCPIFAYSAFSAYEKNRRTLGLDFRGVGCDV